MTLLSTIKNGIDLKKIPREQLPALAREIRERIIAVVSKRGGHLASSLGVVELTLAIHYVFDIPGDSLVWDVGHQAYAHKLLTGRDAHFDTLRTYKGISGFTKRSESPCDAFTVGHSSTSISAGLGIAVGKKLKKNRSKVISVIGDGSMTAGLAYEGLNQAGDSDSDLIVILNDNDMSISPNVGALSSFLSRTLSANYLQNMKKDFGSFLKKLPGIGYDIYQFAKKSENSFKTFVTPGMLFEAFDFDYFGPINGHRLNHLIDIMENIKMLEEPVLLHVTTTKGKGYSPAEKNPVYFHGVGAFDVTTGNGNSSGKKNPVPTYTEIFGKTITKLAEKNEHIVAVTAAMPEGTGLIGFSKKFPDRFFDVGIAEQHAVTFAAGMASQGMKPVVAIYSTFMQRAYDQILHDVCIDSHHVVFALDRGGIVGEDGPTHHGLFDFAFLRNIPNMTIMAPKDEQELAAMLVAAIQHNGPIAVRYPRGKGVGAVSPDSPDYLLIDNPIKIGKAEIIHKRSTTTRKTNAEIVTQKVTAPRKTDTEIVSQEVTSLEKTSDNKLFSNAAETGKNILIIAAGRTVQEGIKAVEELEKMGISPTLVNARFIKPLDAELILELAKEIPLIITVEEHVLDGGFGSAVLELLADNDATGCRVKRIGVKNRFVEHGSQDILRSEYEVDARAIVRAAKQLTEQIAL
ncbi:1-deoxyxylulose-5-phosphate synthase, thiamine-requiring, FAD-requiring [Desulfamplus magnetovallimortis]|uniref:1-deoxy-D-xylulose-5-phosphate synthase n=1 Tax=Desulfamplus magnetovallimortis TaxID=1246637 RepID=L0R421_9BACT|nr:1-deoxy-D-xylulose-5-phosphate synthase [Desulfamplus magnetovallimortis]CCO06629.1 1-deoxyxylulose-5-phosphate synthase,thiamine-requiring, FAD-requiring [Desulfamplus magnetovallimortis BW-1]SLM32680.1 1-deoxyxylulose-5-phosphate synthase, thiamine-requiring, FAD-requiring [Desulfamplus magnetovallimortis]